MKVINLFGGPGVGKSTYAALTYARLKMEGADVELITEYAKDLVYTNSKEIAYQPVVTATQIWRQRRCDCELIVTDSPILLGLIYGDLPLTFKSWVKEEFRNQDNINIFISRGVEYNPKGRLQTEDEAEKCDELLGMLMFNLGIEPDYYIYNSLDMEMVIDKIISKHIW